MQIAIVLMLIVLAALIAWCWQIEKKYAHIVDVAAGLALHCADREKWEDETFERHDRRIRTVTDEVCSLTEGRNEKYEALSGKLDDLDKRMNDFDELAADNIKAQTDAERAFAAGLQSLANFGTGIPSLNVEKLNHE